MRQEDEEDFTWKEKQRVDACGGVGWGLTWVRLGTPGVEGSKRGMRLKVEGRKVPKG